MKFLFLVPHKLYQTKMSRCRFHQAAAISRVPGIDYRMSGAGFPDYDGTLSVAENFACWGWEPDVMLVYKPLDHIGVREWQGLKVINYNEMWDVAWTTREIRESDCQIVVCHHANDMPNYLHLTAEGRRLVHIPHCADRLFFEAARPWAERDIPILLTGVLSPQIYPLRSRLLNICRRFGLPLHHRKHPGYRLRSVEDCERQVREYAALLGRAKIVLTCCSRYEYRLAKLCESAAAGSCVVGDIPQQDEAEHREFMVEVHPSETDSAIAGKIRDLLSDDTGLQDRAEHGQQIMRERYTQEHYAERLLAAVRDSIA